MAKNPNQLHHVAINPSFESIKQEMRKELLAWMEKTGDPRFANPKTTYWDELRYTPDYQMRDIDWQKQIEEYRIWPPFGSVKEIPCLPSLKQ